MIAARFDQQIPIKMALQMVYISFFLKMVISEFLDTSKAIREMDYGIAMMNLVKLPPDIILMESNPIKNFLFFSLSQNPTSSV